MTALYSELQWLAPAPPDFAERAKALANSAEPVGPEMQSLATHALDLNQLTKLAKVINIHREASDSASESLHPLVPFRLAVLSNSNIDLIVPALVASACRHGIALGIIQPFYDQVAQEAFNPASMVNASKPDAVLLALDFRALPLKLSPGDAEAATATVRGALDYLKALRDGIQAHSNAVCIFQSLAPQPETLFGSLDRTLPGTMRFLLEQINGELAAYVRGSGDVLLDVAAIAETVGLDTWHNPRLWNLARFSFSEELIPLYADHVARVLAALRGKTRKALILDLDNVVWGGVIGDDGLNGINIALGDAVGEAHLAVQRTALDLRARGILLAVCSKNTDAIAREPFLNYPEMLLKLDHIAVFKANWNDKATNIQAIADELSLGLDAMVLLDDDPVERGLVRKLLPQVAVPELLDDPAWYARTLTASGYFEALTFVGEDRNRAGLYEDNAKRANLQKQVGGVDAYLTSLDTTITFQPFDATGRARIVQLINKSNQYNLTTRRYTEPQIDEFESDPTVFTLQARLADVFGDSGMISVVICRPAEPDAWDIDTWAMSCRVLGRKVEYMVLLEILKHAREAGIRTLTGLYLPTGRNGLVADHYAKLGFTRTGEDKSGVTRWELLVDKPNSVGAPMKVVRHGFPPIAEKTFG